MFSSSLSPDLLLFLEFFFSPSNGFSVPGYGSHVYCFRPEVVLRFNPQIWGIYIFGICLSLQLPFFPPISSFSSSWFLFLFFLLLMIPSISRFLQHIFCIDCHTLIVMYILLFQQNVKMNLKVVLQFGTLPVTPLWPSQQLPGEDPLIHWFFGYSLSTCHIADIFSSPEKVQIWIKMAQVSDTWSLHLNKKGGKWAEKIN